VHLGDTILDARHGDVILEEHLNEPHGSIGTADGDIDTTVTTLEVLNSQEVVLEAVALSSTSHGEAEDAVNTTSAAESDFSPILRVDIDEVLGVLGKEFTLLEAKGTNKTSLFINSEEELKRTTLDGLVLGDCKASSNTTAIITTKSSLGSTKKFTIDVRNERIGLEVEGEISSLGGDHIKVSLKNNARNVLLALSSRESDADIAKSISLNSAAELLADLLDPSRNLTSVMRRTRDLSQGKEVLPHGGAIGVLLAEVLVELLLDVKVQ